MKIPKTTWMFKLAALLVVAGAPFVISPSASAFYSNGVGDGSPGSPYQIYNCNQLSLMQTWSSASYVLTADIDCSGISSSSSPFPGLFDGSFDGQGHKVYNMTVDSPSSNSLGLFSELGGSAVVKNLSVYGEVTGGANVGLLSGSINDSAQISRVDTHGTVTCTNNCGGLVGRMGPGTSIERSWSDATVGGVGYTYGGLVGWGDGDGGSIAITDVFYRGTVAPTGAHPDNVGGIVGFSTNLTLSDAYVTGEISGRYYIGGIVGEPVTSTISHTFSTATVSGIGMGVLFGDLNLSTATDNYYDTGATGWSFPDDGYGSVGISDPDYFIQNSTSDVFANWDFTNTWRLQYNDYPALAAVQEPYMLCEQPQSTDTTMTAACAVVPIGWGITTWEARWQKQGDSSWTNIALSNNHVAITSVSNLTPGTWYNLQFRYTNDHGTGPWGTVQILTTGTAPVVSNPPTDSSPTTTNTTTSTGQAQAAKQADSSSTIDPLESDTDSSATPIYASTDTAAPKASSGGPLSTKKVTTADTKNTSTITYFAWGIGILLIVLSLYRLLQRKQPV